MKKTDKNKKIQDKKYFKWGLTAFIVIVASMLVVYAIYNIGTITSGFKQIIKVLTPVIDGLVIAYLVNPIMRFIEIRCFGSYYHKKGITVGDKKKKRIRAYSLIMAFAIVAAALYAFFGTVLPQIYSSIESIIVHFPTYYNNIINYGNDLVKHTTFFKQNDLLELINDYSDDINDFITTNIIPNVKDVIVTLKNGIFSAVSAVFNLIIGLIIAIYLLIGKEKYVGLIKKLIYSIWPREKANSIMVDLRYIDKTFGGFLIGKIVDSIIIGIICYICLNIMGTPYAVLVSVIVGVTNIIPFFGPYLGAIPSALLILLVDPMKAVYFVIFILILQQIDGNIIGPAILGNSIGISSFWIVVSIIVFGGFFGILGMLVGVPVFACIYTFIRRRINRRLLERNMIIDSDDYAMAEYIDENNQPVPIDYYSKEVITDEEHPQYEMYDELGLTEDANEEHHILPPVKIKLAWYKKIVVWLHGLFKKKSK